MSTTPSDSSAPPDRTSHSPIPTTLVPVKSTAQAQLTLTNHTSPPSRDASPHRPSSALDTHAPVAAGQSSSVGVGGESSAKRLLQNVKREDEQDVVGGKKRGKLFGGGRRSNSQTSDSNVNEKLYTRKGILMSQTPKLARSTLGGDGASGNGGRQSLDLTTFNKTHTLPQLHSRTSTMPSISTTALGAVPPPSSQASRHPSDSPGRPRSYHVNASNLQPPRVSVDPANIRRNGSPANVIDSRSNTPLHHHESYDVITVDDVTDGGGGGTVPTTQPSPPISLKSELANRTSVNGGERTSSPDSGYGNTPGSDGTDTNSLPRRRKQSQEDPTSNTHVDSHTSRLPEVNGEEEGASTSRGGMVRATMGESSAANHVATRDLRARGSTSDSAYSIESSEPSPVLPPGSGVVGKAPLKATLSAPVDLVVRRGTESSLSGIVENTSVVPSDSIPDPTASIHPSSQFQFHVSRMTYGTNVSTVAYPQRPVQTGRGVPSSGIPNSASLGDFRKIRRQSSDNDVLSQTQPPVNFRQQQHQQKLSPVMKRKKYRSGSQAFSKSAEVRSHHSVRSLTLPTPLPDEKDYFQVTDELAKENSHFALSEALLAVVEQYKANCCEQQQQQQDTPLPPSSPATPLPIGGSPNQSMWAWSSPPRSQGYTPPGSESGGMMGTSMSSWGSMSSVATNDDPYEGFSPRRIPKISLLELIRSSAWDISAESTAQKLLQHMAAKLTGYDGEELNLSQMVLKLPTDFLTSLQLDDDLRRSVTTSSSHIRGSKEWAPPRKQLIYHVKQPSRNLQKDLAAQGYRCTGCGMQVDPAYARNFRFCNYTGKYFCQNCHTNAISIIPAHILEKWSFKRFYVSNFARDFLNKIYMEPVLTIPNSIYSKVPIMAQTRDLRKQLVSIRQYLKTCRRSQSLKLTFDGHAPWTTDVHTYALDDFYEIKGGTKLKQLRSMLSDAIVHVKSCPICMGKGFVCEFCHNSKDIIFPFEVSRVGTCENCKCCFHKECYSRNKPCPRCTRIKERQRQRLTKIVFGKDDEEEEDHVS